MIFSVWHDCKLKLPESTGWYFGYEDVSLGCDNTELGYYYFDRHKDSFYSNSHGHWCNVTFWTDISDEDFNSVELNPAERLAAENVLKAIQHYNTIRGLSR